MKERNNAIDIAKAIGLFLVIFGHLVEMESNIFILIFSFHMPLFFFLSGMCFNYKKFKNFLEFLNNRIKKRIIPYFCFVLLGITMTLIIPEWREGVSNISGVTLSKEIFYYTQPEAIHVGQIWFLVGLFSSEIIFYIINKLFDKFNRNKFLMIITYALLGILGSKILVITNSFGIDRLPFKMDSAIVATIFMGIGYELRNSKILEKYRDYKEHKVCFFIIFLCFAFVIAKTNGYVNICNCYYRNILLYFISALCGIFAIYLLSDLINKNKLLQFYGTNTLFMFGIHSFFITLYTEIITIIFDTRFITLENIPLWLCIVGSISIFIVLLPITIIYNKLMKIIKNKKLQIESAKNI